MPFLFPNESTRLSAPDEFVVRLRPSIRTKFELFDEFSISARFPEYFGRNWDALFDCMVDLSWINLRKIAIVHSDLPLVNEENELGVYLRILKDAVNEWGRPKQGVIIDPPEWMPYVEHELLVIFPAAVEATVKRVLSSQTNRTSDAS